MLSACVAKLLCLSLIFSVQLICLLQKNEWFMSSLQVSEDPLTVKVDHLKVCHLSVACYVFHFWWTENFFRFYYSKNSMTWIFIQLISLIVLLVLQDKPYDKDDDIIKATSFEVISTLRDVLKTSSLWRDHVQTYTKVWILPIYAFLFSVLFFLCLCVRKFWRTYSQTCGLEYVSKINYYCLTSFLMMNY